MSGDGIPSQLQSWELEKQFSLLFARGLAFYFCLFMCLFLFTKLFIQSLVHLSLTCSSFSSSEPAILLASAGQGSRALAKPDFLSKRKVFVLYSQPIRFARFDGKYVNRTLPMLDQARVLDPCHRPEGSWALGTRVLAHFLILQCLFLLLIVYSHLCLFFIFCFQNTYI